MRMICEPETAFSSAELALELNLSRNHLTKIPQHMARIGLIEIRRGGGGARLAKAASEIRLGDVIPALLQVQALVDCFRPEGGHCVPDRACGLKSRLHQAEMAFLDHLNRSTLADIATAPDTILEQISRA